MLPLKELTYSKVRFGLIALAIALVVSLTMLMSAMAEGLVTGMTGAKGSLEADALVFQKDSRLALERSFLDPEAVREIRQAPGVAEAYEVGHVAVSIEPRGGSGAESVDARIFGLGGHWGQLPAVEGESGPLGPDEAVADVTAKAEGIRLGDDVGTFPGGRELTVVGFTEDRRYIMAPAFYVSMETWESLYLASVLGDGEAEGTNAAGGVAAKEGQGAASIAAVLLKDGTAVSDLAHGLDGDFEVASPGEAALAANGMDVMVLAVNGIQAVSLLIGALLIGVFFYITTLHKTGQIAALKALGASNGHLYRSLLLQIGVLVTVAIIAGALLALGAGASMPPTMAFDPRPGGWLLTVLAVYAMAVVGSLFSLRSILRIDPATALDTGDH